MSTRICVSIFSGSSAREIKSLMFDRSRVENLSNMPMGLMCLAVRAELTKMRRERERDALVGRQELFVVEMRKLESFGHHDRFFFNTICAVHEIRRVELEQAATQRRQLLGIRRQRHDLHPKNRDGRREMDDDAEIELAAGSDDPQSGFHFRVARSVGVQPIKKAFNVVLGHHLASLPESL